MTITSLVEQARDAGRNHGTAHKKLSTSISEAATAYGIRSYTDQTVQEMRKAFADACAQGGTTRNNGLGLFARAWDSLKAQLGLEDRPSKGKGRNARKAPSDEPAESADEPAEPIRVEIVERVRELTAAERQAIKDEGVAEFLTASKLNVELVQTLIDAWGGLRNPSASTAKDAQFALLEACKAIGGTLTDGRVVPADVFKTMKPADTAATPAKPAKPSAPKGGKSKPAHKGSKKKRPN